MVVSRPGAAQSTAGQEARRVALLAPVLLLGAIAGGLIAGRATVGIEPALLVVPFVLLLPVAMWKWTHAVPIFLLSAATLVEEWKYTVGSKNGAITDKVPLFRTFAHGTIIMPIEAVIIVALLVWILKAALKGSFDLPRSVMARVLLGFWVLLAIGFGVGLAHGGKFNFALWEVRPWLLLTAAYVFASTLLTSRRALQAVLWTFVLVGAFKAVQGDIIFFTYARRVSPRPDAILGHEEAFFFGFYILLTLALWLYGQQGRMRAVATVFSPLVVIADMANSRRTAWAILIAGLIVLLVVAWHSLPNRRRALRRTAVVLAVVSAAYFPAYWNHNGTLAQPARALHSAISPSSSGRDASSDLYRKQENANLILNIKQSGVLGKGFGIPINYALPIVHISNYDSMIAYITHDGVLWIWMRLGIQGELVFWLLIGAAMMAACQLARTRDRQLAMLGALTACPLV